MTGEMLQIALEIRQELDQAGRAFQTYTRDDFTTRYRLTSGNQAGRFTKNMASELDQALLEHGLRTFPPLYTLRNHETARVFRSYTVASSLLDVILTPSQETDQQLGEITTKIKGMWQWEL